MTIEELRSHIGCLIHLKAQLYWSNGYQGSWDDVPERFCILLGVGSSVSYPACAAQDGSGGNYYLHLLIDGQPKWIRLNKQSFEVVK